MNGLGKASPMDMLFEPGALECVFQPVCEVAGSRPRFHYIEALTRGPVRTNLRSAGVLFDYARRKGRAAEIDRLCVAGALRTASRVRPTPALGLNVHASTLERDAAFVEFLLAGAESHGVQTDRLTLEIVEHAPRWSGRRFKEALAALRKAGIRIALDDVGLGHSSYRLLLDCRPDYLKVDTFIVQGCHVDQGRAAVLESLVLLADRLGARLIAEGVEDEADLAVLKTLDIELVQGYLLGSPMPITELERKLDAGG
jgi:EAL domain-containing protein (putative c-di-GMP-specific phosphodiesterase class I)